MKCEKEPGRQAVTGDLKNGGNERLEHVGTHVGMAKLTQGKMVARFCFKAAC